MRTKTVVEGLKNSQKIRIIVDGVGIYCRVKDIETMFATSNHASAIAVALHTVAKEKITGFCTRVKLYDNQMRDTSVDVQIDIV